MNCQTTEIINTENIQLGASQIFYRGRSASASGLILPSPVKKSLNTSKERILLHHSAVQFSTGGPVQFSPGIYRGDVGSKIRTTRIIGANLNFSMTVEFLFIFYVLGRI